MSGKDKEQSKAKKIQKKRLGSGWANEQGRADNIKGLGIGRDKGTGLAEERK